VVVSGQLEDEGLVRIEQSAGRKVAHLTDEGAPMSKSTGTNSSLPGRRRPGLRRGASRAFEHVTDGRLTSEDYREAVGEIVTSLDEAVTLDATEPVEAAR
jgi:hypothetical protein